MAIMKTHKKIRANKNLKISKKAVMIMGDMMTEKFKCIANEACSLLIKSGKGRKNTLTSRDIQSAAKLVLPGDLGRFATIAGIKACTQYVNNSESAFF
jgi:histone H2B